MKTLLVALSVLALSTGALASDTYKIDVDHSLVGFKIRHFVTKVQGKFTSFDGEIKLDTKNLKELSADAAIDASSINTDNKKRDDHLRSPDFFDVKKFPKLTFKSKKTTDLGNGKFKMDGDLTLHGVTKPITLEGEFTGTAKDPWGNTRAGLTAQTKINRKDYGIVWNKTLDAGGMMLGDDIDISIEIEAIKK